MHELIESSVFAKYVYDYLTDEEYAALQWYLSEHVDAGDLIPASGGCRKMRWGVTDKGKRGGVCMIYFEVTQAGQIWLLAIYAETRQESLPASVMRLIKDHMVKS